MHGDGDAETGWLAENLAQFRTLFNDTGLLASVLEETGDDYRFVLGNAVVARLYGRPPGSLRGLTGRELGASAEEIKARRDAIDACHRLGPRTQEFSRNLEGGTRWFVTTYSPMPPAPSGARRAGFVAIDITATKAAELAAAHERERVTLALDAASMGIWEYDLADDRFSWDARTRELFGLEAEGPTYDGFISAVHPEDAPRVLAAAEAALAGAHGGLYQLEHRILTKDGSVRWVQSAAKVVSDTAGVPLRVLGTLRDISTEVRVRERQDVLVAELNHRVKNNMATVQAIARQTLRASPEPAAFRAAFEGRIGLLAQTHELLSANAWESAVLSDLLRASLSAFLGVIQIEGPMTAVPVPAERALTLSLMLHELATNAVKYGALSTPEGRVRLTWWLSGDRVELEWVERGGPLVRAPTRKGFGSRLLDNALGGHSVNARVAYHPEGLEAHLTLSPSAVSDPEPARTGFAFQDA